MAIRSIESMDRFTLKLIMRLLYILKGYRALVVQSWMIDSDWTDYLGLPRPGKGLDTEPEKIVAAVVSRYESVEKASRVVGFPRSLARNLKKIGGAIGLSRVEQKLLGFVVLMHVDRVVHHTADWVEEMTHLETHHALHLLLDEPEEDIRAALAANALLAKSCLVQISPDNCACLFRRFTPISQRFAHGMAHEDVEPLALLRDRVRLSDAPELGLPDYAHIRDDVSTIKLYLKDSLKNKRAGVNVLLYGPPGTGKTQLVRAIGKSLRSKLFEVACESEEGAPLSPGDRMASYSSAQCFLQDKGALLLFDEIEDVFADPDPMARGPRRASGTKAWMNKTLEENPVPTFWVSNNADCLDGAFIRRFDIVLLVGWPPYEQRKKIIEENCGELLEEEVIERLADFRVLAPAVVTRASKVVCAIQDKLPKKKQGASVVRTINSTLRAQGYRTVSMAPKGKQAQGVYDPRFTNADMDLLALGQRLDEVREARICLYGPPGTGKSAYARWLAQELQVPLIERKASDLMSKYLGETEQKMADAFREASKKGGVLLIDEVDSFLQDRRNAQRSWEVQQVNEMLTQMESFEGIFIASTNMMDGLDPATLRRFDLKLEFGYLSEEQAMGLLRRYCQRLKLPLPGKNAHLLRGFNVLTPGDFATVARRHKLSPNESVDGLVACLGEECAIKEGSRATIGFVR